MSPNSWGFAHARDYPYILIEGFVPALMERGSTTERMERNEEIVSSLPCSSMPIYERKLILFINISQMTRKIIIEQVTNQQIVKLSCLEFLILVA
jgi:hypothetical protein